MAVVGNRKKRSSFIKEEEEKKTNEEIEAQVDKTMKERKKQNVINKAVADAIERSRLIKNVKDRLETQEEKRKEEEEEKTENEKKSREKSEFKDWLKFYVPLIFTLLAIISVFVTFYFLDRLQVNY